MIYVMPDHPDIESALATGYPRNNQPEAVYCEECGEDITEKDQYEDMNHKYLCKECLLFFHKKGWY